MYMCGECFSAAKDLVASFKVNILLDMNDGQNPLFIKLTSRDVTSLISSFDEVSENSSSSWNKKIQSLVGSSATLNCKITSNFKRIQNCDLLILESIG